MAERSGSRDADGGSAPQARDRPGDCHQWTARLGGVEVSEARRLRTAQAENIRLKMPLVEATQDNAALKDVVS